MVELTRTVELDPGQLSLDDLIQYAIDIKSALKQLDASLSTIQEELTTRLKAGDLDASFTHDDWSFTWSAGRTSWSYPKEVKEIEVILRNSKRRAEADGSASKSLGAPYWTIREPKP